MPSFFRLAPLGLCFTKIIAVSHQRATRLPLLGPCGRWLAAMKTGRLIGAPFFLAIDYRALKIHIMTVHGVA